MGRFAEGTAVSIAASKAEIEKTLTRYGCQAFASSTTPTEGRIHFKAEGLLVSFTVPMPTDAEEEIAFVRCRGGKRRRPPGELQRAIEQEGRRRWRCLALAIKAKLEAVESGIVTFEEEFLSHVLLPDGNSAVTHFLPAVREAYSTGRAPVVKLLTGGEAR